MYYTHTKPPTTQHPIGPSVSDILPSGAVAAGLEGRRERGSHWAATRGGALEPAQRALRAGAGGEAPAEAESFRSKCFPNAACLFISLLNGVYYINFRVVEAACLHFSAFLCVSASVQCTRLVPFLAPYTEAQLQLCKRHSSQPRNG